MFTRMFVPLDGSARAELALPLAARLAQIAHGTVILGSVINPSYSYSPALAVPADSSSIVEGEIEGAKEYLARTQKSAVLTGVQTEALVGVSRPPSAELIDLAQGANADIIVMCSHGRTGLMRWALGSVAQAVVRASAIPVLVLKADGPIPSGTPDAAFQVLVPLDGSPLAEAAIQPAAQLATVLSAPGRGKVTLLQVIRYPVLPSAPFQPVDPYLPQEEPEKRDTLQDAAAAYLHGIAQRFTASPLADLQVRVTTVAAFSDDVAGAIVATADGAAGLNEAADIITMATHGHTGMQRIAIGSIAERVLQTTKRPLLVVPPPTRAAPATQTELADAAARTATAARGSVPAMPLF